MKPKLKICDGACGRPSVIWKNHEGKRFCKKCWSAQTFQPIPKSKKAIPKRSSKRIIQEGEYSRKRKLFLDAHPSCKAALPSICTHLSTDVHHMQGRIGDNYLDESTWLSVCRSCHMYIETHPKLARELGLSKSKT